MGILLNLKEGKISKALESGIGGINFVSSFPDGFKPASGGTLSVTFRIVMDSFFITSSNSSQAYAIVMGD
jgi:hypothetical protein